MREISVIAVAPQLSYYQSFRRTRMTSQVAAFARLSDRECKAVSSLPKLAKGDRMELHVRRKSGTHHTLTLPLVAGGVVATLIDRLLCGERVAVLTEEQELSPTQASAILGISRPLVVLRMDRGELPFRYVGKHRRATLKNVLALKARIDIQRHAMEALSDDAEDLRMRYGA
jgi:hypothetical protein